MFWQGISFWLYFHRCEGAASPECPKAIVEGIIEEEEEEDEDEEGGGSVNKRKKEDDTEVESFLLCFQLMFAQCFFAREVAHSYPNHSNLKGSNSMDQNLYIVTCFSSLSRATGSILDCHLEACVWFSFLRCSQI